MRRDHLAAAAGAATIQTRQQQFHNRKAKIDIVGQGNVLLMRWTTRQTVFTGAR